MQTDSHDAGPGSPPPDDPGDPVEQRASIGSAINAQRQQLVRAQAIAQTVAYFLHQRQLPQADEPDVAYCLNVVDDLLGETLEGLDDVLRSLSAEGGPDRH